MTVNRISSCPCKSHCFLGVCSYESAAHGQWRHPFTPIVWPKIRQPEAPGIPNQFSGARKSKKKKPKQLLGPTSPVGEPNLRVHKVMICNSVHSSRMSFAKSYQYPLGQPGEQVQTQADFTANFPDPFPTRFRNLSEFGPKLHLCVSFRDSFPDLHPSVTSGSSAILITRPLGAPMDWSVTWKQETRNKFVGK